MDDIGNVDGSDSFGVPDDSTKSLWLFFLSKLRNMEARLLNTLTSMIGRYQVDFDYIIILLGLYIVTLHRTCIF
jgi:hypothetical protein